MRAVISRQSLVIGAVALLLAGCFRGKNHPGWAWFPDMANSPAYETYAEGDSTLFPYGMSALEPAEGSIPRGYQPFHYDNTEAERARAAAELVNPVALTEAAIENGTYNYDIFCAICHGSGGEGDGHLVTTEKLPVRPPSYFDERMMAMPDGDLFFTMHYGKGQMGPYASQLSQNERWEIIHYINYLQATAAEAAAAATDTTTTEAATNVE